MRYFSVKNSFLWILILLPVLVCSQQAHYSLPNTPLFKRIAQSNRSQLIFTDLIVGTRNLLGIKETPFNNYHQQLLYHRNRLYVFVNASGILYRSTPLNPLADSIHFQRIDSTEHFGYNINCYPFIYKDDVYNIGGYGFWRWNGQLRFFQPTSKCWNIVPLNTEYGVITEPREINIWYQPQQGKLLSLYHIEGNQAVSRREEDNPQQVDKVLELNLETKEWSLRGTYNELLASQRGLIRLLASADSGLLVERMGNIEYWNLITNSIKKNKINNLIHLVNTKMHNNIVWVEGNVLFYGLPTKNGGIDSIKLQPELFEDIHQSIYTEEKPVILHFRYLSMGLLGMTGIGIGIGLFVRRKRGVNAKLKTDSSEMQSYLNIVSGDSPSSTQTSIHSERIHPEKMNQEKILSNADNTIAAADMNEVKPAHPEQELFNETERSLLRLIIGNLDNNGKRTSIDEMNRVLGMAQKSLDNQKRKRSDVISEINKKYQLANNNKNVLLIQREKSISDARTFVYMIPENELNQIRKYL